MGKRNPIAGKCPLSEDFYSALSRCASPEEVKRLVLSGLASANSEGKMKNKSGHPRRRDDLRALSRLLDKMSLAAYRFKHPIQQSSAKRLLGEDHHGIACAMQKSALRVILEMYKTCVVELMGEETPIAVITPPWKVLTANKFFRAYRHRLENAANGGFLQAVARGITLANERLCSRQLLEPVKMLFADNIEEHNTLSILPLVPWEEQKNHQYLLSIHRIGEARKILSVKLSSAGLTAREKDMVALALEGIPNRKIADLLFISLDTVKTHLKHAYKKLGVANRSELALALQRMSRRTKQRAGQNLQFGFGP